VTLHPRHEQKQSLDYRRQLIIFGCFFFEAEQLGFDEVEIP
jgi:hypothetical protein